jgi:hypothetical protein
MVARTQQWEPPVTTILSPDHGPVTTGAIGKRKTVWLGFLEFRLREAQATAAHDDSVEADHQ